MGLAKVFLTFTSKFTKKKQKRPSKPSHDYDDSETMWYDRGKHKLRDKILLDRRLRFFAVMFLAAVVVPVLLYIYYFEGIYTGNSRLETCFLKDQYRIPCFPGRTDISEAMCTYAACCFNGTTGECHHSLPSFYGFNVRNWTDAASSVFAALTSGLVLTPLRPITVFSSQSSPSSKFGLTVEDPAHLIITFAQGDDPFARKDLNQDLKSSCFNVTIYGPRFSFDIHRRTHETPHNSTPMVTISHGPLISSKDYSEITLGISPGSVMYGLGGLMPQAGKGNPYSLYNRPERTGSHPILVCIDEHGQFYGLFIDTAGPLEIEVYEKSNLVIVRLISNIKYDIHVFAGPGSSDVMNQITNVIGKPKLPPYWALGFHVCPNLDDSDVCSSLMSFVNNSLDMDIPWDSHCLDHSMIINRLFFNTGKGCESGSPIWTNDELTRRKLILTLPTPVPITTGTYGGALIKNKDGTDYVASYNSKSAHYPDFFKESSGKFLVDFVSSLENGIPKDIIGGYLLDNNWPEEDFNERSTEKLDYIPQDMNGSLSRNTIWWEALHSDNATHISLHNRYGLVHTRSLASQLPNSSIVFSTASFPGLGAVGGCHAHSAVEVESSWTALKEAFSSMLGLGLSGIPFAGSPICGNDLSFNYTTHGELCVRWYQLAALSPVMRVSSGGTLRDPVSFPAPFRSDIRRAIHLRYKLLPYFYKLFKDASETGMPVVRPMSFEFPSDINTWNLTTQYMLGSSLLVAPILEENVISISVYFPEVNGSWYDLEGGQEISNGTGGYSQLVTVTRVQAVLLLRPGSAILLHEGGRSTAEALVGNYSLTIGLLCKQDIICIANGSIDLPETTHADLEITADNTSLTVSNIENILTSNVSLNSVQVYGLRLSHEEFELPVNISLLPSCPNYSTVFAQYDLDIKVLEIMELDLSRCNGVVNKFLVMW